MQTGSVAEFPIEEARVFLLFWMIANFSSRSKCDVFAIKNIICSLDQVTLPLSPKLVVKQTGTVAEVLIEEARVFSSLLEESQSSRSRSFEHPEILCGYVFLLKCTRNYKPVFHFRTILLPNHQCKFEFPFCTILLPNHQCKFEFPFRTILLPNLYFLFAPFSTNSLLPFRTFYMKKCE